MTQKKTYYSKFMNNKNILLKSVFILILSISFYMFSVLYFYNKYLRNPEVKSNNKPIIFSLLSYYAFIIVMASNFKKKKTAEKWNLLNKNKTKINKVKVFMLCRLILIGILVFIWIMPLVGVIADAAT